MKKYLYSLTIAAALLGFTSCDSKQDEPHIQWYPVVTLEGEDTYYLELGEKFTLPGYSAINTLTMEDATSKVIVKIYDVIAGEYVDAISTDSPAMYNVYYLCPASEVQTTYQSPSDVYKQRDIYVYDPTVETDLEGIWMVNLDESFRVRYSGTNAGQKYSFAQVAELNGSDVSDGIPVEFEQILPGFFWIDDVSAGLISTIYDYIGAYGPNYPVWYWQNEAYLSLSSDNVLTYLTGGFGYSPWQDNYGITGFEGAYNPEDGTISYRADMGGQGFYLDVVLEQPE